MTEDEKKAAELAAKTAELEATEKTLQQKKAELEKVSAETEEAKSRKESELDALSKELGRIQTDIASAREERRKLDAKDKSFQERLRGENLEAAKAKIFSEFKLDANTQTRLLEEFMKHDSGSVNQDLIYQDLLKAYASINAVSLIETQRKVQKLSEASEEFKATMSSASFSGSGFEVKHEEEGLTKEDLEAARWAGITTERYKELRAKGKIE